MKTYFRISDARNFKELQELITSTKAARKSGHPITVGGYPNNEVSIKISKPADSKTKKWGKLYTSIGNHSMLPLKAIKENNMRSSIPVYIAIDDKQHDTLKAQYESKHQEYSLALCNSMRDEFDDIDRTNDINEEHGDRIRNFFKTHPLTGFKYRSLNSHISLSQYTKFAYPHLSANGIRSGSSINRIFQIRLHARFNFTDKNAAVGSHSYSVDIAFAMWSQWLLRFIFRPQVIVEYWFASFMATVAAGIVEDA